MSSNVCQGLQSCTEPGLVEPRVLIQNLAPPIHNSSQSNPWTQKPKNAPPQPQQEQNEMIIPNENDKNILIQRKHCYCDSVESKRNSDSLWSSIQALTRTSQNRMQVSEAEQQVYVHPLVKRSSSGLSTKSLEMCTENLGSETGSSIDQSIDDFPSPSLDSRRRNVQGMHRSRSREFTKKMYPSVGFPPPLTSIGGSGGVHMRTHREGGRLVLEAVSVSSCSSYFKAERANGRLRLSLMRGGFTGSDDFHDLVDEYGENAYNMQHNEEDEPEKETDNDEEEVEIEDAAEDDANERAGQWEDESDVNGENVVYEGVGVGELARLSRCKEGGAMTRNGEMSTWEPYLVTTS
nr:protein FANTASTIC FOUR 1-like [Coffea arabica]XP_027115678.1 protein FANTASTIC FOUR 1-like [Coffea arabica]